MIEKRKITPPSWMTNPAAVKVMEALNAGADGKPMALFVGGCVRNALLDQPVNDIDIATIHRPDSVMKILPGAGIRAIPTGLDHGTVTALVDEHPFEITTLRKDVETDGRHAVIAFTDLWEVDAQRRDFTINTLLAAPDGAIYDPTGQGLSDLDARRVVFVGDPQQRIAEDYLRILRFFRFHGQYAQGNLDAAGLAACREHAAHIKKLSRERITQELIKIASLAQPWPMVAEMIAAGIVDEFFVAPKEAASLEALAALQEKYEAHDALTRLGLLCGFDSARRDAVLALSGAQREFMDQVAASGAALKSINRKKVREQVYRHGNAVVLQAYLVWLARKGYQPDLDIMDIARYWQAPVFPIGGRDLMGRGMRAGKELGEKLKTLEEAWIKSGFKSIPKY